MEEAEAEAFIVANARPRRPAFLLLLLLLLARSIAADGGVLDSPGRTMCAHVGEQARIGRRKSRRNKTAIDREFDLVFFSDEKKKTRPLPLFFSFIFCIRFQK